MSVLIDTSVWSIGLRRRRRDLNGDQLVLLHEWQRLLVEGEATLIPTICQEILSGIATPRMFEQTRQHLMQIPLLPTSIDTFVLAAEFFNTCLTHGIVPDSPDMTICAAAHLHNTPIFTTDPDFPRYAKHLPIVVHHPRP
jgi:predicted nucleic acid-binding protein